MNCDEPKPLESRVHALERANRQLRLVVLGMAVALLSLAMVGSGGAMTGEAETKTIKADSIEVKEVKAAELVVTTSSGTVRAKIRARSDGRQGLEIRNASGQRIFEVQ